MGVHGKPYGARLAFLGFEAAKAAHAMLPALDRKHREERGRQYRAMGLATAALVSVVVAYIYGVPLIARNIVALVPPQWEEQLGDTAVEQIEVALKDGAGFEICDPNPDSLANRAIARFAKQAVEGSGTPFTPRIQVVRSSVPNAFALPGGNSFYFSALLEKTETPDEFAGVMAHELGHVVHRHGMEQLISTSATGLLIGFILGDMTGLSVAGGIGAALIDTRFSREAEREADRYSLATAQRLGFSPAGMVSLLERVSTDDAMTRAMALLSTHPLTSERRAALETIEVTQVATTPAFTPEEWAAIKAICDKDGSPAATPVSGPTSTAAGKTGRGQ